MAISMCSIEVLLQAFHDMVLVRRFEEKAAQLYTMGLIGGFCHLYIGQEAIVASLKAVLNKGDSFITSYRCHGFMLVLGTPPGTIMAELLGKEDGCSGGRGGSMHMFDVKNNFYGGHGIVGAQVPIGTGLAFAEKYRGTNNVCVAVLGDGAVNQGQVYESWNLAKLFDIPVLYVIENNLYALGTSLRRSTKATLLYQRGIGLGIEGAQVDGMNFSAMYSAIGNAVGYVREKQQPFILEALTYRYRGHSMSDPAQYRTKKEVESYKERDPIELLKNEILSGNIASTEELEEIKARVCSIVKDAADFAQKSPLPQEAVLLKNVTV